VSVEWSSKFVIIEVVLTDFKQTFEYSIVTAQDTHYWLQRWREGRTGFHQPEVNPYLRKHWDSLALPSAADVFVPLCGKSLDLLWLSRRCGSVTGVEISEQALREFFHEHGLARVSHPPSTATPLHRLATHGGEEGGLDAKKTSPAAHDLWCCRNLRLYRGDFFTLQPEQLPALDLVYDRAALVALDQALRRRYVHKLLTLLQPHTRIFLITLSYPQQAMPGPPFSVELDEVQRLFGHRFEVSSLSTGNVIEDHPRFADKGLQRLQESALLLSPK